MTIDFNRSFTKQARQLKPAQKRRLKAALLLFETDPQHPDLYNHALKGRWTGHCPIAFGGDWRAHYLAVGKNHALFVALGRHGQLYK